MAYDASRGLSVTAMFLDNIVLHKLVRLESFSQSVYIISRVAYKIMPAQVNDVTMEAAIGIGLYTQ